MSPKISTQVREDLVTSSTFFAEFNSGFIDFYNGTQPAGPGTALSGNTLLATCGLAATALIAGSTDGVATFGTISNDTSVDASGTPTFARFFKSDHTTALMDCTVSTSGADINFDSTTWVAGGVVAMSSLTVTMPAS